MSKETKLNNFQKMINREKPDYIPTMAFPGAGIAAYAGVKAVDTLNSPEAYVKAFTAVFDDMWVDVTTDNGLSTVPAIEEVFQTVQYKIGPDGTTLEHIQLSLMKDDEYPQLIADPDKFVKGVLLPRKYPWMFEDPKSGIKAIEKMVEINTDLFFNLGAALQSAMDEKYGIISAISLEGIVSNPLDTVFDSLRGFKGTLIDLRRHPEELKQAIQLLWETRDGMITQMPIENSFPFGFQLPHMPAYLSVKQFDEYYMPYEKALFEHFAAADSKIVILLEGSWKQFFERLKDLPKDSALLMIDDDEITNASKTLGSCQIIEGGYKLGEGRLFSRERCIDEARRVIDGCLSNGPFIFGSDKNWISPGDVNENMVSVYNFVHEYRG